MPGIGTSFLFWDCLLGSPLVIRWFQRFLCQGTETLQSEWCHQTQNKWWWVLFFHLKFQSKCWLYLTSDSSSRILLNTQQLRRQSLIHQVSSSSQKLPSWWLPHKFLHKFIQGKYSMWSGSLPSIEWVGKLEPSSNSELGCLWTNVNHWIHPVSRWGRVEIF